MSSTIADLQRLNIAKMAAVDPPGEAQTPEPPPPTDVRTPVLTDVREYASTEVSTSASKDAGTEGRANARKGTSKPVRASVGTGGQTDGISKPDFLDAVEARLSSREPLIGGVKATVDMSPELSSRAKRYLADRRGQNTRQVLIALLDAYLAEKGY